MINPFTQSVIGTHTYAQPGTYSITITIFEESTEPSAQPYPVLATINSTAVVTAAAPTPGGSAGSGGDTVAITNNQLTITYA